MVAEMNGWLKAFLQYKFLVSLNFYLKFFDKHLQFEMQKSQALITDIKDAMKEPLYQQT